MSCSGSTGWGLAAWTSPGGEEQAGIEGDGAGADDEQKGAAAQLGQIDAGFVNEVPPAALRAEQRGLTPQDRHLGDQ